VRLTEKGNVFCVFIKFLYWSNFGHGGLVGHELRATAKRAAAGYEVSQPSHMATYGPLGHGCSSSSGAGSGRSCPIPLISRSSAFRVEAAVSRSRAGSARYSIAVSIDSGFGLAGCGTPTYPLVR